MGEGGGFSGQWNGFAIEADGSLVAWSGPVAESNSLPVGTLTPAQMTTIWRDLTQTDFYSQEMDERGEMTAFIRVNADSVEHRVSWIPRAEGIESAQHPVEALYWRTRKTTLVAAKHAEVAPETK